MLFLRLKAWFYVQYTIPPPAAMLGHWLIIYPRLYRLQHSPNLVDVGLYEYGNTYLQELHVILSNSRASLLELPALANQPTWS